MKHLLPLIAIVSLVAATGCQKKATTQSQARSDVMDISPLASTTTPAYGASVSSPSSDIPAPTYTPSYTPQPAVTPSATPAATSSGSHYTIRKGDTFYSLARTYYGSGKEWQRIASANPGVDPHKLRVGQSIIIP